MTKEEILIAKMAIGSELLDIARNAEGFSNGDLQGAIEAQVSKAVELGQEIQKTKNEDD